MAPEPAFGVARSILGVALATGQAIGGLVQRTSAANLERERGVVPLTPRQTRKRLLGVCVVTVLLFALVLSRLVSLQILTPDKLTALNSQQRMVKQTLAADRGAIFDRNGVELALSLPRKSVFVDPSLVEQPQALAELLAPVLGLLVDDVRAKVTPRDAQRFVYLRRHVEDDVARQVQKLAKEHGIKGVGITAEPKRYRPADEVATSIVGFTDIDGKAMERSGIEFRYDELLTGTPGQLVFEQSPDGRTIPVGESLLLPAQKGDDLVLTLDRSMQFEVQRILAEQVRAVSAKGGIAIVSKPDTGEVLAMANVRADEKTGEVLPSANNAGLTSSYEPGSVMKLVTATGAIEEGLVTPETVLNLPVSLQIKDGNFSDAEPRGPVAWSVKEIITESSNVGTIMMGQKLGKNRVYDYLRNFGFGDKTAIDFPNEQAGHVPSPHRENEWWDTSMGTVPIGQGVSVTPMQMLAAYNVIANRGQYISPILVSDVIDKDGIRRPTLRPDPRQVVSTTAADQLNLILRNVVSAGTGKKAAVDGYTVAGKTGTSRKAQANGSYISEDGTVKYESTFVGFAPAEAPAVSVIVIIDEPMGEIYGGLVAAPAYAKITDFALRVLGVAPPATDIANGHGKADPKTQAELVVKGAIPEAPPYESTADGRKRAHPAGSDPTTATTRVPGTTGAGSPSSGNSSTGTWSGGTATTATTATTAAARRPGSTAAGGRR